MLRIAFACLLLGTVAARAANYQTGREFAVPEYGEVLRAYVARVPDTRCDGNSLARCLEILRSESPLDCRELERYLHRCEGPKLLFQGSGIAHASRGREWREIRVLNGRVVAASYGMQVFDWGAAGDANSPIQSECEAFGVEQRTVCPASLSADGTLPPLAPRTLFSRRYSSTEMNDIGSAILFLETCMRTDAGFRTRAAPAYQNFRNRHADVARFLAPGLEKAIAESVTSLRAAPSNDGRTRMIDTCETVLINIDQLL
jgi:hypothetical protein